MSDKITSVGVFDIEMETYHGDCCDGPSVSGSGLVKIDQQSLAHYWWDSYHNPHREDVDTTVFRFGRAAHAWVLGEPKFAEQFVVAPYEVFNKNPGKQWYDKWKADVEVGLERRTLIKPQDLDMIKCIHDGVLKHPLLKNAFVDGKPEQSLIWKDKETGIWLKSRPDWLPNNLHFVPNFKTCVSAKPEAFAKQAFNLGYHQGAALCLEGLREVMGWKDPTYYFVAVEKKAPWVGMPFTLRDVDIVAGELQNRAALRKLARALDADEWPGYAEGAVEIAMPAWTEKLFTDRSNAGEFEPGEAA